MREVMLDLMESSAQARPGDSQVLGHALGSRSDLSMHGQASHGHRDRRPRALGYEGQLPGQVGPGIASHRDVGHIRDVCPGEAQDFADRQSRKVGAVLLPIDAFLGDGREYSVLADERCR